MIWEMFLSILDTQDTSFLQLCELDSRGIELVETEAGVRDSADLDPNLDLLNFVFLTLLVELFFFKPESVRNFETMFDPSSELCLDLELELSITLEPEVNKIISFLAA